MSKQALTTITMDQVITRMGISAFTMPEVPFMDQTVRITLNQEEGTCLIEGVTDMKKLCLLVEVISEYQISAEVNAIKSDIVAEMSSKPKPDQPAISEAWLATAKEKVTAKGGSGGGQGGVLSNVTKSPVFANPPAPAQEEGDLAPAEVYKVGTSSPLQAGEVPAILPTSSNPPPRTTPVPESMEASTLSITTSLRHGVKIQSEKEAVAGKDLPPGTPIVPFAQDPQPETPSTVATPEPAPTPDEGEPGPNEVKFQGVFYPKRYWEDKSLTMKKRILCLYDYGYNDPAQIETAIKTSTKSKQFANTPLIKLTELIVATIKAERPA